MDTLCLTWREQGRAIQKHPEQGVAVTICAHELLQRLHRKFLLWATNLAAHTLVVLRKLSQTDRKWGTVENRS